MTKIKIKDKWDSLKIKSKDSYQNLIQLGDNRQNTNYIIWFNAFLLVVFGVLLIFLDQKDVKTYHEVRNSVGRLKQISDSYELNLTKSQVTLSSKQDEMETITNALFKEKKNIISLTKKVNDAEYTRYLEQFLATLDKRLQVRDELLARYQSLYQIYKDYRKVSLEAEQTLIDFPDLQIRVKHMMLDLESVRMMEKNTNREAILQVIRDLRLDIVNQDPIIQEKVGLLTERAEDIIKLLRYLDTIRSSMKSDGYYEQLTQVEQSTTDRIDSDQMIFTTKMVLLFFLGIILTVLQALLLTWFLIGQRKMDRLRRQAEETMEKSKSIVSRAKQYALEAQRGQYRLLKNFCGDFSNVIERISHLSQDISQNVLSDQTHLLKNQSGSLTSSVGALETWLNNYLLIHIAREEWRPAVKEEIAIEKIVDDVFCQSRFYAKNREHEMAIFHQEQEYQFLSDPEYMTQLYMNMLYITLKWRDKGWIKTHVHLKTLSQEEQNLLKHDENSDEMAILSLSLIDLCDEDEFVKRQEIFTQNNKDKEEADQNEDRFISAALYFIRQISDVLNARFAFTHTAANENIFNVEIPVVLLPQTDGQIGVPILQNKNAIIVSPYANILYTLDQQIKAYGMNVTAIADKYAALGHIVGAAQSGETFDVIIIDHHPPDIDAGMLAKVVRDNNPKGLVHIIAMTTEYFVPTLQTQMHHIDAVLTKPVRPQDLHHLLEHFIEIQLYGFSESEDNFDMNTLGEAEKQKRFLAIMNEDLSASLIKMIITKQNYQIDIATTGSQVMECLEQHVYDFVLVSNKGTWVIPENVIKDIRRHHSDNKEAVVIMFYEEIKQDYYRKLVKSGFDDFIELPLSKNGFLEMIEQWQDPIQKRLDLKDTKGSSKALEEKNKNDDDEGQDISGTDQGMDEQEAG